MTIDSITADIARCEARFDRLNHLHWLNSLYHPISGRPVCQYRMLKPQAEKTVTQLAQRIERLQRFASMMRMKEMLNRL